MEISVEWHSFKTGNLALAFVPTLRIVYTPWTEPKYACVCHRLCKETLFGVVADCTSTRMYVVYHTAVSSYTRKLSEKVNVKVVGIVNRWGIS